ncbi:helix-turn-helix domain-containing protein, partial [Neglectibacter sp. X4]
TVSRYETGQREPNISMIEKLSDVLNVPVSAFFLSDEDYKKIGNTTDLDFDEAGFDGFAKKVLDSKDIQLVNNFNLLNEFGKAEALKRI